MRTASVALIIAFAALVTPTSALSTSTVTRVKRAVRAEVRDRLSLSDLDVSCTRLTSSRFKCKYVGLGHSDLAPCHGTAKAVAYARSVDVTAVSRPHCDW